MEVNLEKPEDETARPSLNGYIDAQCDLPLCHMRVQLTTSNADPGDVQRALLSSMMNECVKTTSGPTTDTPKALQSIF